LRKYFTGEKQTTVSSPPAAKGSPSGVKRTLSDYGDEPSLSSTPAKRKPLSSSSGVIIIDSDLEEDAENVFQRSNTKFRSSNYAVSPSYERNVFGTQSKQFLSASTSKKTNTRVRPPAKWSCVSCTYINHPLISYCEMCSTGRDSQPVGNSTELSAPGNSTLVASPSSEASGNGSGEVSKLPSHRQNSSNCLPSVLPSCSSTESSAVVHSDLVACSLSEEVRSFAATTSYVEEVSGLSSCLQNSSSLSLENQTRQADFTLESDVDEIVDMSEMNELSNCTSPPLSAVGKNTSRLKRLNIDSDKVNDDSCVSHSYVDRQQLASDVEVESCLQPDIDFSDTTVHGLFQFSCSRNSARIYVYDKVFVFCSILKQISAIM